MMIDKEVGSQYGFIGEELKKSFSNKQNLCKDLSIFLEFLIKLLDTLNRVSTPEAKKSFLKILELIIKHELEIGIAS